MNNKSIEEIEGELNELARVAGNTPTAYQQIGAKNTITAISYLITEMRGLRTSQNNLIAETQRLKTSQDNYSKKLIFLTWVIIVLTGVMVVFTIIIALLTIVLVIKGYPLWT